MSMSLPRQNNPERESMSWLQEQIRNTPAPEVILHLGAGLCSELPLWQQSGARRIVLVEPNPELLPELWRRTEGMEQVEIVEAAVAPEPGRGNLRLFNFPLLASLREPTALYQSLPGLQQIGRAAVELTSIEQLLDRLDIDGEGENWLVIDTPGEEAHILQTLEQIDCLHRFARIFITAGIEPLHGGAKSASELLSLLEPHGFEPVSKPDYADADWPRHHLRLDRMALECKRLKIELAETHRARTEAEEQHQARIAELENALSEQNGKAEQLAGELQTAQDEAEQLKEALVQASRARDDAQGQASARGEQIESLTSQLKAVKEQSRRHEAQLEKAQADLSVALRLQQLRENDLKELQSRYGQVVSDKDEQHELLVQLHQRLSKAAEYLQLAHAEGSAEALPEKLREALVGKEKESGQTHQDD